MLLQSVYWYFIEKPLKHDQHSVSFCKKKLQSFIRTEIVVTVLPLTLIVLVEEITGNIVHHSSIHLP